MKLGQKIQPNNILDEFENGPDRWKNMAARGRGHFLETCSEDCPNDILDEFKNGILCLKNMAAKGQGIFSYMAIVKS